MGTTVLGIDSTDAQHKTKYCDSSLGRLEPRLRLPFKVVLSLTRAYSGVICCGIMPNCESQSLSAHFQIILPSLVAVQFIHFQQ